MSFIGRITGKDTDTSVEPERTTTNVVLLLKIYSTISTCETGMIVKRIFANITKFVVFSCMTRYNHSYQVITILTLFRPGGVFRDPPKVSAHNSQSF